MAESTDGSLSQEDLDSLLGDIETDEVELDDNSKKVDMEAGVADTSIGSIDLSGAMGEDLDKTKVIKAGAESSISNTESIENMALLLDVKINLSVEIGRTKMQVDDVLGLGAGAIVELDKLNGEFVDIMVNNRLVARGEIVAIDGNFGVKIADIVDVEERLKFEL